MDQHTGQQANAAIFAANGPFRRRLLKVAGAAALALVAAWLIALVLGVLGGFELLPGLPSSSSTRSSEASSSSTRPSEASSRAQDAPAPAPVHSLRQSHHSARARAVKTASPSPVGSGTGGGSYGGGGGGGTTRSQGSDPRRSAPHSVQPPTAASTPPSTSPDPTTTTEAPADSPGSLPSGSDLPGQLP